LGEWRDPRAVDSLASIARRDHADRWIRTAVLSSAAESADLLAERLLHGDAPEALAGVLQPCALIVGVRGKTSEIAGLLKTLGSPRVDRALRNNVLVGLGDGLHRSGGFLRSSDSLVLASALSEAKSTALDAGAPLTDRIAAVRLLSYAEPASVLDALRVALSPPQPERLQLAAVEALGRFTEPTVGKDLLAGWSSFTPKVRQAAASQLVSRPAWIDALVDAAAKGAVATNEVLPAQRSILRNHRDATVRTRFAKVFREDASPRREVLARYKACLSLAGSAERGAKVFERSCMACHRVAGKGYEVGPNLTTSRFRAPAVLLEHVIDPNLEVQPADLAFVVAEKDGKLSTGLLAADGDSSIMLKAEQGKSVDILKSNIDEISNTGKSLMPEGLEKDVDVQQMADLLAYLTAVHYDIGSEPGARRPKSASPAP
jgi:putative heme-binding domain-containing protein